MAKTEHSRWFQAPFAARSQRWHHHSCSCHKEFKWSGTDFPYDVASSSGSRSAKPDYRNYDGAL